MDQSATTSNANVSGSVREGLAEIFSIQNNEVFYNPVQCVNRDLSVAMIQTFINIRQKEKLDRAQHIRAKRETRAKEGGEAQPAEEAAAPVVPGITIFEALAASGLRSIRYAKELTDVDKIVVNDLDPNAVETIRNNIERNGLDEARVVPSVGDCSLVMHQFRAQSTLFDVIDLDPYGSAAPFLDAAVQAVAEGGLLCVTCTDGAVLCGKSVEVAYSKYGATPVKAKYMHENAVRIVLQAINQTACRYKRHVVPQGCFFIDFYLRCFVRVYTSPIRVKDCPSQLSLIHQCMECPEFVLQPVQRKTLTKKGGPKFCASIATVPEKCPECSGRFHIGGPVFTDAMHDVEFLKGAMQHVAANEATLAQHRRVIALLTVACEELPDVPLFHTIGAMASALKCNNMSAAVMRSALFNAGYRVSQSHTDPEAIKTDAPHHVVWDIMRTWVRDKHPVLAKPGSAADRILSKEISTAVDFTFAQEAQLDQKKQVARFLPNPEGNWGPKKAAAGGRFVGNKRRLTDGVICGTKGDSNPQPMKESDTDE